MKEVNMTEACIKAKGKCTTEQTRGCQGSEEQIGQGVEVPSTKLDQNKPKRQV